MVSGAVASLLAAVTVHINMTCDVFGTIESL